MENLGNKNTLNSLIDQIVKEHKPGVPPSKGNADLFDKMSEEEIEKAFELSQKQLDTLFKSESLKRCRMKMLLNPTVCKFIKKA